MKKVCDEYNKLFLKIEFVPIQKAFIGPHYLNLIVRFPGKSLNLLLGLGERYEGIELSEDSIPSIIRQRDRFLDFIRKNLVGSKIGKLEVDCNFRRVRIPVLRSGILGYLDLMWLERELYFSWQTEVSDGSWTMFNSWQGESNGQHSISITDVFSDFIKQKDPVGDEQEFQFFQMKPYLKRVLEGKKSPVQQSKSKKFLEKKIKNIQSDINRFKSREIFKEKLLIDSLVLDKNFYDLCGIKVKFKKEDSYYQRKNILFQKIKNLDAVESMLQFRLKETEALFEKDKNNIQETKIKLAVVQPIWGGKENKRKSSGTQSKNEFRILTFELPSALRIRISLDARSNDELRNQSNKEHFWFHQEHGSGAHLVAKTDKFDQLKPMDLNLIASILHHFSKLSGEEIALIYATVKEIKGVKGSAGMVTVKKPKYLTLIVDLNWKEKVIEIN